MDVLQQAATNYRKLTNTEYLYTLGTKNRSSVILEFIGCNLEEFTHIYGLDHLTDIPEFNNIIGNTAAKRRVFKNILNGDISMAYLESNSKEIKAPIQNTYNPETNSEYTIYDRIIAIQDLESILDNVSKASLYNWDSRKSTSIAPGGKKRNTDIGGDFLLVIPGKNPKTHYYMFAHKERNINPKEPLRLKIHSAILDGVDLTSGQGKPYPILHVRKYTDRRTDYTDLYVKSGYTINEDLLNFTTKKKKSKQSPK